MGSIARWAVGALLLGALLSAGLPAQGAPRLAVSVDGVSANHGDAFSFPDTQIDDSTEPITVTLLNEGDEALELSSDYPPELSGEGEEMFFLDSSETVDSLATGESTSLDVYFFPSERGTRKTLLTIATNDPERPLFELSFAGTGYGGYD